MTCCSFSSLLEMVYRMLLRNIIEEHIPKTPLLQGRWDESDDSGIDLVDRAWQHVQTHSDSDPSTTIKIYTEAVMRVEEEARSIYCNDPENPLPETEDFVQIMIKYGCFLLQVALCSLGGSKVLDYPRNDQIFGEEWDKLRIRSWVSSMFSISRQFPIVILQEFMKQSFFKRVLKSRKEWKRPRDLPRMILYNFLVAPALDSDLKILNRVSRFINGRVNLQKQQPPTLLHALWSQLTGPRNGLKLNRHFLNYEDDDSDDDENFICYSVRSATELQKAGIVFKSNNGKGIRGIKFRKHLFNSILYLPPILIDSYSIKSLLKSLIRYEEEMYFDENRQEVCAYLQFIRDLIRSPSDAKILAIQGIIHVDHNKEEELTKTLENLNLPVVRNNRKLELVRHQIHGYIKPSKWEIVTYVLGLTLFLTVLQTIYALVSFQRSYRR